MGNDFGNVDSYDYYQYEPFMPIFFKPKIDDETKNENNKESTINSKYLQKKSSTSSLSEFEDSFSASRKSTLDEEDLEQKIINSKKIKTYRKDKFKKIFKNLKNSPIFDLKNEIKNMDENDYYLNFDENDDIRKNYYTKLIYKNKWSPGIKSKTHNNIFIFDWDDTLLPTTFLTQQEILNEEYLPEEYEEIFSILEESIINLLNLCINKGDVYIITNSSIGWVEFSANKYYPNINDILNKIHIISARNEYEDAYPGETKIWKEKTFLSLKEKINLNLPTNMVCFGDSIVELEAGKKLASKINNSFIKTIKFKQGPEPEDIIRQLNLLENKFNYIYSQARNLSIKIDQKK